MMPMAFSARGPAPLRPVFVALAALTLAAVPAPARTQTPDPVVARVNGAEIHASDVAIAEEELGSQLPPMTSEAKRDYVVTYLADTLLVAQAAAKKNIAETEEFKRRMVFSRNRLLSEALLEQEAKAAVTEAAMREIYDEAAKKVGAEKEVRASHILVETEQEAKAVLSDLKKGEDFAELAKKKSKDPSASKGGDLGYFTKDQMVPEFAEVAFSLEPGKVSEPVKSQFGWHIIRVDDQRARSMPEFDKVKDQIKNFLIRKAQTEMVAKLRAEARIERLDAKSPSEPQGAPGEKK